MVQRLTLRRRLPYSTSSNRHKIVRTPGGKLTYIYLKKPASPAHFKCGDCKFALPGVVKVRPHKLAKLSRRMKTVNRAYGGSVCHWCVRARVMRAFLIEESKIVSKIMKAKQPSKK